MSLRYKLVGVCVGVVVVAAAVASSVGGATGTRTTSTMSVARFAASATELFDGRVLIAGGAPTVLSTNTVEIYDAATGQISPGPPMLDRVDHHTAVRLPDGRVLVAGGISHRGLADGGTQLWRRAEVFDPATGVWSRVADLPGVRWGAEAALLPDGRVLLVGGDAGHRHSHVPLASTLIYDPSTGSWSDGPPMSTARSPVKVITLPDGRIMAAGNRSAEIFDPATQTWSAAGAVGDAEQRPAITLLPDGRVFYAGFPSSIFDPGTNIWTPAAPFTQEHRYADAVTLGDGRVWLPGGFTAGITTEVYDPSTNTWSTGARLNTPREVYTLLSLADGSALIVGGSRSVGIPYETQVTDVDRFTTAQDTPETPTLNVPSMQRYITDGLAFLSASLSDDASGAPYTGVPISFTVVAGPHAGDPGECSFGPCVSNQWGQVTWKLPYRGPRGTDTVEVWADMDGNAVRSAPDLITTATIEWLQRPTAMSAEAALVTIDTGGPILSLASELSARLTTTDVALPGKRVDFFARSGSFLCSATTGADGVATCGGTNEQLAAAFGYTATFAGDEPYVGSSAHAPGVKVRAAV